MSPALDDRDVHVWQIPLDQPASLVAELAASLAPNELARAGRYRFEHLARRFTVARGALRAILAGYLGRRPGGVVFEYGPFGKPYLRDAALRFNLAHSGELALCAVARRREVGIDLEQVRPIEVEEIAEQYFSPNERAALRELPPEERRLAFFRCWTQKEAYLKARGDGLTIPLDQFDVAVAPDVPPALLASRVEPGEVGRWSMLDPRPAPGYVGALAVEGHDWTAAFRAWSP